MQSQAAFTLSTSGQPFLIPNLGLQANNTSSLILSYTYTGSPTSSTVTVEGISSGNVVSVLDSYSGNAATTRTINLTTTYDGFQICGSWVGGQGVSIGVSLSTTGPGAAFSAVGGSVANIHSV